MLCILEALQDMMLVSSMCTYLRTPLNQIRCQDLEKIALLHGGLLPLSDSGGGHSRRPRITICQ